MEGETQPETCENFSLKCLAMMLDPKAQAADVQVGDGEEPVLMKYDAKRFSPRKASASSYMSPSQRRPRYSCVPSAGCWLTPVCFNAPSAGRGRSCSSAAAARRQIVLSHGVANRSPKLWKKRLNLMGDLA